MSHDGPDVLQALGAEIVGEEKGKGVVGAPFVGMPSGCPAVPNHTRHKLTKFHASEGAKGSEGKRLASG